MNKSYGLNFSFSRASTATYFDINGVLQTAAIDELRYKYNSSGNKIGILLENSSTNIFYNSLVNGSISGTPGTMPTNWSTFGNGNGISTSVIGSGTESGISYIDVRFFGTPTANSALGLYTGISAGSFPANKNDVWTYSCAVKLVGGTLTNTGFVLLIWSQPSNIAYLPGTVVVPTINPLKNQIYSKTSTLTNATVTGIFTQIRSNYYSGNPVDVTLRVGVPQLEKTNIKSSFIPTTSTSTTRASDQLRLIPINDQYNYDYFVQYDDETSSLIQSNINGEFIVDTSTLAKSSVSKIYGKKAA